MIDRVGTALGVAGFIVVVLGGLVVGSRLVLARVLATRRPDRPDLVSRQVRVAAWLAVGLGVLVLVVIVTDVLGGDPLRPGGVGGVAAAFVLFAVASLLFRRGRR